MSSKRVTISARTIHALLAGRLAPEQYLESHKDPVRILDIALKEGRSICGVHLETSENEDDDWLTFEIGEPDASIHPFVTPPRKTPK